MLSSAMWMCRRHVGQIEMLTSQQDAPLNVNSVEISAKRSWWKQSRVWLKRSVKTWLQHQSNAPLGQRCQCRQETTRKNVLEGNLIVNSISFNFSSVFCAAIKIMTSSQAHVCVRWLARDRIRLTASWPRRLGPCWRNTINHWRRPKGSQTTQTWKDVEVLTGWMWDHSSTVTKPRFGFCLCHSHPRLLPVSVAVFLMTSEWVWLN